MSHCHALLSRVQVCLAVLKLRPPEAWARGFFAHVLAVLPSFSAQELANTLTAAGYLGLEPGESLGTGSSLLRA